MAKALKALLKASIAFALVLTVLSTSSWMPYPWFQNPSALPHFIAWGFYALFQYALMSPHVMVLLIFTFLVLFLAFSLNCLFKFSSSHLGVLRLKLSFTSTQWGFTFSSFKGFKVASYSNQAVKLIFKRKTAQQQLYRFPTHLP